MRFAASSEGSFLRKQGIKPVIAGKSNRKKRIRHDKKASKSAAAEGSRTSAASLRAVTSAPETSFPPSVSLLFPPIGFEII
jgi:hypothetical protein